MKIHFIGIGGIGVSALAKYYLAKGHEITGSDLTENEITEALKEQGANICIGPHRAENVPFDIDMVVYSPAVHRTNPEYQQAVALRDNQSTKTRVDLAAQKNQQMEVLSYPQALGQLTQHYFTIAVSGTHGKSTTCAMIGLLLIQAGFDPTVIVGTKLREFGNSNCRVGQDSYLHKGRPILVIEADEHFASFLNYSPDIIVLTTVEADHLDYYKNIQNIIKAFKQYVALLPKHGIIIANKDDRNIAKIVESSKKYIQYYSSDWTAATELRKILRVPGEYNVSNAHAALTVARALGIPDDVSYKALGEFTGTWRRFEIFPASVKTSAGEELPYTLVSDYGHHPTEVRVTVQAARETWPTKQLWLVFQPHQYQRTFYFFRDFVSILSRLLVERLIVADIYDVPGREQQKFKEEISSARLVKEIGKKRGRAKEQIVLHIPTITEIEQYLLENLRGGEVVMVMGAGDIYNLTLRLTRQG